MNKNKNGEKSHEITHSIIFDIQFLLKSLPIGCFKKISKEINLKRDFIQNPHWETLYWIYVKYSSPYPDLNV